MLASRAASHAFGMFLVTEAEADADADADAIGVAFDQEGELSAAIELRQRFPGITENAKARAHVRTIVGWKQLPSPPCSVIRLRRRGVSGGESHLPSADRSKPPFHSRPDPGTTRMSGFSASLSGSGPAGNHPKPSIREKLNPPTSRLGRQARGDTGQILCAEELAPAARGRPDKPGTDDIKARSE